MTHPLARIATAIIAALILTLALVAGSLSGAVTGLTLNRDAATAQPVPETDCSGLCATTAISGTLGDTSNAAGARNSR